MLTDIFKGRGRCHNDISLYYFDDHDNEIFETEGLIV